VGDRPGRWVDGWTDDGQWMDRQTDRPKSDCLGLLIAGKGIKRVKSTVHALPPGQWGRNSGHVVKMH